MHQCQEFCCNFFYIFFFNALHKEAFKSLHQGERNFISSMVFVACLVQTSFANDPSRDLAAISQDMVSNQSQDFMGSQWENLNLWQAAPSTIEHYFQVHFLAMIRQDFYDKTRRETSGSYSFGVQILSVGLFPITYTHWVVFNENSIASPWEIFTISFPGIWNLTLEAFPQDLHT